MSRDHILFLLIGLLGGFIGGYLAHEAVVGVQPARIAAATESAQGTATAASQGPPPSSNGAPAGGGPPMAEINRLKEALAKNPDDAEALVELANLNFDIQNWAKAQELYDRFLKLRPKDPDVLTDLGITLRAQGHFDEALASFREAEKLKPDHWQSRFNEVVVLAFDKKDFAEAEKALAALRKLEPDNPDISRLADEVRRLKESG